MTAKEMFEELGYEIELDNKMELVYIREFNHDGYDDVETNKIIFDKIHYLVSCTNQGYYIPISFIELKAINKQIEELGWED